MKSLFIFTIYFAVSGFPLFANNLSQGAHFDSVDGFVQKLKAFQPTKSKSDLATLFTVKALDNLKIPKLESRLQRKELILSKCFGVMILRRSFSQKLRRRQKRRAVLSAFCSS